MPNPPPLVSMADFILQVSYCAICVLVLLIFFAMYKIKPRPRKTQILCPRTKRVLMDFEVIHGRCIQCVADAESKVKNMSKGVAQPNEVMNRVKDCEDDIKKQLHESNRV